MVLRFLLMFYVFFMVRLHQLNMKSMPTNNTNRFQVLGTWYLPIRTQFECSISAVFDSTNKNVESINLKTLRSYEKSSDACLLFYYVVSGSVRFFWMVRSYFKMLHSVSSCRNFLVFLEFFRIQNIRNVMNFGRKSIQERYH